MTVHRILIAALFATLTMASSASAQWLNHPTAGIPRTPDGKPDLQGFYQADAGAANQGLEKRAGDNPAAISAASNLCNAFSSCCSAHCRSNALSGSRFRLDCRHSISARRQSRWSDVPMPAVLANRRPKDCIVVKPILPSLGASALCPGWCIAAFLAWISGSERTEFYLT
jgi:hypothetical protein